MNAAGFLDSIFLLLRRHDVRVVARIRTKGPCEAFGGTSVYTASMQKICGCFRSAALFQRRRCGRHFREDMFGDVVGMFSESLARTFDSDSDGEIARAGELRDSCKWNHLEFGTGVKTRRKFARD